MKIIDILYYNLYNYFERISSMIDNHYNVAFALGFCLSLFIIAPVDLFLSLRYCIATSKYIDMGITVVVIFLVHFGFPKNRREKILNSKPCLLGSYFFSKVFTLTVIVSTYSYLLWGTIWIRHILDECYNR